MLPADELEEMVFWACKHEVMSPKPGNVSPLSDGHDMEIADFLNSAQVIAPIMADPSLRTGERILHSIQATRRVVNCNTNLGIVLLLAPICTAVLSCKETSTLKVTLNLILERLDVEDADNTYQAIRLAEAGGMGKVKDQDISATPTITLREAMLMAADRDQIAFQYVNKFNSLWTISLPALLKALNQGETIEWAAAFAYLNLLSKVQDSLIYRKHGSNEADKVSDRAKNVLTTMQSHQPFSLCINQLTTWDKELKQKAVNPGTTADMIAATLLLYRLQERLS